MAVLVDTNVLVSGLINEVGPPGQIVDLIYLHALDVAFDDRILDEYYRVLNRPKFGFDRRLVGAILEHLELVGMRVNPAPLRPSPLPDPADLPFIEVAVAVEAEALITGNPRHFEALRNYGVPVLEPADFLASGPDR